MYIYNKTIMYELKNNPTFIKVEISNNEILCDNKIIKKDIKEKFKNTKLNVKKCIFYTSLYDYDIIKHTYFWDTIKNIEIVHYPIYKKNKDLTEYINWLNTNLNNNDIRIYETSKFTKREHVFNDKSRCEKSIDWGIITNYKFKTFNHLFYHAGNFDDIERYAYIHIRSNYTNLVKFKFDDSVTNVFKDQKIDIWNKFDTDFESIKNTMYYMLEKMKKGILIGIKNNKLLIFLPFSKYNFTNDYFTELYFDENDKRNLEKYSKNPNRELQIKLENTVKYYFNKYKISTENVILDRTKWVANDCFFRYQNFEGDKSEALYEDFFVQLCKNRKLPDSIFFINIRDHPILNKNLYDSYTSIISRELDKKYKYNKYVPILSVGPSFDTFDIPLITQDDWLRVESKYYPDDCKNGYIDKVEDIKWEDKINKAVFRGSSTGCYIDDKNVRIKASLLSKKYPDILDAGITSYNRKIKKNIGKPLEIIKPTLQKATFMTLQEKIKYKYILNLDGHVAAFRLGHEFSLKSVILLPKSKYYLWFSSLLEPFVHFVPVKEDLSDLIEKINWCIENDNECKKIAINGYNFYKKYLSKDGIFDYMQNILSKISVKSLNFKKYNQTIAVITIYRNNQDNSRLMQKRFFLFWMNRLLKRICNYDIIVVEQSKDTVFNIGKLKNIGFDYIQKNIKKNYDNYIFTDIDTIPDSQLIDYFFKITNSLNTLARFGTRYTSIDLKQNTPFVGALISCTKEIFQELNGYPNNFIGWGGEDTNLLFRLYELKKSLYVNNRGKIIDIEETNKIVKNISNKTSELKIDSINKENNEYEKNYNYKNFKENGLSNLNYEILDEIKFENNYHIMVDLKLNDAIKLYPHDYNFDKKISKEEYKKLKNNTIYKIKQITF